MTDQELQELQNSMLKQITEQSDLESDIRDFAKQTAGRLIEQSDGQVLTEFRNQDYLISARSLLMDRKIIVEVRARPWIKTPLLTGGWRGGPDMTKHAKTASAEYDRYDRTVNMQQFTAKLLTTLFFNLYGLLPEAEEV